MSQQKKRKTTHSVTDSDNIKDDEHWTDGDFELISSDNVRFKVPSYYLLAHSSVLRDALSVGSGEKRIEFTDCQIEGATTIRCFLQIASEGVLGEDGIGSFTLYRLVRFLQKYECSAALHIVLTQLRDSSLDFNKHGVFSTFVAGATADDEQTCLVALSHREFEWGVFDPHTFSLYTFRVLPYKYCWALGRAWVAAGDTETLPREFSKYLAAAKKWEERKGSQYFA